MSKPDTRDFEERYSACFADLALKAGCGLLIGRMISSFFLKGVRWPWIVGGTIGSGMAYSNCENSLNAYLKSMSAKPCPKKRRS